MKKEQQILLAGVLTLGLVGCGRVRTQIIDPPTPVTFVPTEGFLRLPTIFPSPTVTEFPTLAPTDISSPTPEIPFGEHKCVLPLKAFNIYNPFLEKRTSTVDGAHYLHLGVDMYPEGDKTVVSPCDGKLKFVGRAQGDAIYGFGNVVVIEYQKDGKLPVYAVFAHLEKMIEGKKEGDKILANEVIGVAGKYSGNKDDLHLHLQVWTRQGWIEKVVGWDENILKSHNYDWSYVVGSSPKLDDPKTVKKYLLNPLSWLESVTGRKINWWERPIR
jgi:murein DD-endopeptidase MepM/ murein hydrolase activator NlpD